MATSSRAGSAAERLPSRATAPTPRRPGRVWGTAARIIGIVLLSLIGLVVLALFSLNLAEDRIRGYAEAQLNEKVQGYDFRLGRLDLHPFTLGLDLEDIVVRQKASPEPPVARIPAYRGSLHWGAVLRGAVVSDHVVERPVFHFTRRQAQQPTTPGKPGQAPQQAGKKWQDAVTSIYPVTINEFKIEGAELSYVDGPGAAPFKIRDLQLLVSNLRNVRAEGETYPTPIHMEASFAGGGHLTIDGKADPLSEPLPHVHADLRLDGFELRQVLPIASRFNVYLRRGTVSTVGHLQTGPNKQLASIQQLSLDGVQADYVHVTKEPLAEKAERKATEAAEKAQPAGNGKPATIVRIAQGRIKDSEFGMVNKTTQPEYRVFLSDVDAELKNLSNRPAEGIGEVALRGKFMGTGVTVLSTAIRPEIKSPDFDLNLRIEDTRLPAMNDLLRAHGKFDVTKGRFSVYTELKVRDGEVVGYVKPLFKDMEVYHPKQDRDKPILKQVIEGVIGGVSGLLQSSKTDAVATKAEISGRLDNPKASTWEALGLLIRNAFLRAVLPGFDRGVRGK
jgi:hypothetical protein